MKPLRQITNGSCQLLLAAINDIQLRHVCGKAVLIEVRTGGGTPSDIPGIAGTADGAVHQMKGIGEGIEHYPGSGINACPLADGTSEALVAAGEGHRIIARFLGYVTLSAFKGLDHAHGSFPTGPSRNECRPSLCHASPERRCLSSPPGGQLRRSR
ncbi:MAG: hypothetical protein A4E43_01209 [Methanosaeta sp. PtaB.Bin005]|nr:MAG: hypothetical protein A4E43_01209 [Methanosaeta sp. PtaB.Bin005]